MALDPNQILGRQSSPLPFSYAWKDCVLYALGVGAKADELDYLYEGRGPRVLPTFAVVPSFHSLIQVIGELGLNPAQVLHGEQRIVLHDAIPPEATLATVAQATAVYDKGKAGLIVVEAHTQDEDGRPLFDNVFSIFVRGEGGFGGERGPEAEMPAPPEGARPDFEVTEQTSREQALLYRLSGDINPLHADPGLASLAGFAHPILHGLCTFGFAGRALVRKLCGGDGTRLHTMSARFAGTVFPGDTLTTAMWRMDQHRYLFMTTKQDGRPVLTHAVAELK